MPLCPACQQPASKRNGLDPHGRQKYACRPCRRTFTEDTASAFSGYRWPRDVIIMAVRWYLAYPLSVKAVATTCPGAQYIRTGLHRARGETTKAIERSHVPMRDRLRNSRGLKRTETGQHFLGRCQVSERRRSRGRLEWVSWQLV